jgi:hypothetical protein
VLKYQIRNNVFFQFRKLWTKINIVTLELENRVLVGKPEGKNHWGDPDVDGRIILKWIFRKWEGVMGLDGVGSG